MNLDIKFMSKIFTLIFTVVVLSYVFLLYSLRITDPENSFNKSNRNFFLRSKITRILFFLNSPGDARFEYLSSENNKVFVEIDYQVGREPNENVKQWVENMIFKVLRKGVEVKASEEGGIPESGGFSDKELRVLAKGTRDPIFKKNKAYLHVIYVSKSIDAPSNTGLVLTANDLFIFRDRIEELSGRGNIRSLVEESTIKHEFGHLLGLEHVDRDDCVMSESVEVYERSKYQFESIPTDFCEESLEELRRIRGEAL
jgi:hypothetical protein